LSYTATDVLLNLTATLLTGTDKSDARAKFVTKNTYVLANAAQTFGDFGQHLDGATVEVGVAFTALTVCIELAAMLERELPKIN